MNGQCNNLAGFLVRIFSCVLFYVPVATRHLVLDLVIGPFKEKLFGIIYGKGCQIFQDFQLLALQLL